MVRMVRVTAMNTERAADSVRQIASGPAPDPRFWLLISPTLPVGGYSYSHGLESAVLTGWVHDFESARDWIGSLALRVLPRLELPLIDRLLDAFEAADAQRVTYWNEFAHATRESNELLLEEREKGGALVRLFPALGITSDLVVEEAGFATAYAQVCSHWQVPKVTALQGYAWIWFEMLVAAAIKLVPLGHSDGQRLLLEFNNTLDELVSQALECADDDIGAGAPGLGSLSSGHETQSARLFRS